MAEANQHFTMEEQLFANVSTHWGESGFLGQLRQGKFDKDLYLDLCTVLLKLNSFQSDTIKTEWVSVTWFIPIFVRRMREYIDSIDDIQYYSYQENLEDLVANILGYP